MDEYMVYGCKGTIKKHNIDPTMKKSLENYSEKCIFASIMKKTILTIMFAFVSIVTLAQRLRVGEQSPRCLSPWLPDNCF